MSSTNKTTNLELSQFIGSDKPQWLVDYNGDMSKIDAGVATVKAQADATDLTVASHTSSIANLSQATSDQATAITALRTDVDGNTGSINTINSLIGNGEPTTTDKTLIGAINELKSDIDAIAPSGDVEADDVSYDNTSSGLTATDVQAAIDEVYAAIPSVTSPDAEDVTYDNTSSGLSATNVQAAIDELATSSGSVSVTADGVKTYSALFDELHALIDSAKISGRSFVELDSGTNKVILLINNFGTDYEFSQTLASAYDTNAKMYLRFAKVTSNGSVYLHRIEGSNSVVDSSQKPTSGMIIKIVY